MYEQPTHDIYEFARQYLSPFRIVGREIRARTCPYCRGGPHGDLSTFTLNMDTGAFLCHRGTCGAKGGIYDLAEHLHVQPPETMRRAQSFKPGKQWSLPTIEPKPRTGQIESYFEKRCIGKETLDAFQISADGLGNILFPFYRDGSLVYVKYRKPQKHNRADRSPKEWQERGCCPILFGMDLCVPGQPIVITEGQIDCMALYEAGVRNVVSVPSGCDNMDWIEPCWEWLEKFKTIIIFGDNDPPGKKMVDTLVKRLGEDRCKTIDEYPLKPDGEECKDANEILYFCGPLELVEMVDAAREVPIHGIIDIADVVPRDPTTLHRIKTMIPALDESLGGLEEGTITVFTGKPGSGKLLSDDTPVFTHAGWKTHGELIVGDEVVGLDGKFKRVLHVFPKGYANMEVSFSNGEKIRCHENHEWVVETHAGNGYRRYIMTAKEIYEQFKDGNGYTLNAEKKRSYRFKLPIRTPMEGETKSLPVDPYTLGAWLGDGQNNNPNICTHPNDYAIVEKIMSNGHEIAWQTTHKETGCIYTSFKGLRQKLQIFGMCHSRKTTVKHIPDIYMTANFTQRLELLAGLIDTDGHLDKAKNYYTFSTTEIALVKGITDLLASMGWRYYISTDEPQLSTSGIQGRKACYSVGFAPRAALPCVIERKRTSLIRKNKRVAIVAIQPCTSVQGNCIMVEDGIYCAGKTMLPTHNSTAAGMFLLNAIEQGDNVCAYSGELTKEKFQEWICLQAAGSDWITLKYDPVKGKKVPIVPPDVQSRILDWLRGHFFIYDNQEIFDSNQSDAILKVFTIAARRYGAKLFLLDNVMTALSDSDEETAAQGRFCNALKRFALRYGAHVVIVAHPRKTKYGEQIRQDDVGGNSAIVRLANSAVVVEKPNLRVIKARDAGLTRLIECVYCGDSRRVYQADKGDLNQFSWNKENLIPPLVRADSMPEYGTFMAQQTMFA